MWALIKMWRVPLLAAVALAFLVGLGAAEALARQPDDRASQLAHHGKVVTATVIAIERSDHDSCTYRFTVAGTSHERTEFACGTGRRVGSQIPVWYLESNPHVYTAIEPRATINSNAPLFLILPIGAVIAVALMIASAAWAAANGKVRTFR